MTTTSVTSGHTSTGFNVTSGNELLVLSGGSAVSTTVQSGGTLVVSGGTETSASISAGGSETVSSSGSASGDQIRGTVTVTGTSATVTSETVFSGGAIDLYSGSANGTTVSSGGKLLISGGNTATNTTLVSGGTVELATSGAVLSGSLTFSGGGNTLLIDKLLSSTKGDQAVISGFTSTDKIDVTSVGTGGTLTFTTSTISGITDEIASYTVASGTEAFIFSGTATYTSSTLAVVSSGGREYIEYSSSGFSSGGTVTSVTTPTSSGAYTETSGNTLLVLSGGSVSAATIDNGAFLVVSGGFDASATISSGGTETVSAGSATGDEIYGNATVNSGASVTSETVASGGTLTIKTGVSESATTILAGGTETVLAGAASGDFIYGYLSTISGDAGAFTNETVESGGTFLVQNANVATNTTVVSGGTLLISGNNGSVTGTVLSGGGTVELDSPKANISSTVTFEGGGNTFEVAVVASSGFGDQAVLSGFSATDKVDITAISATGATLSFTPNSGASTTSVTVSGTGGSETLIFGGLNYDTFTLSVTADTSGGAELVYNPNVSALTVSSGQTSNGITFGAGQTLTVQSGGTVSGTLIESGGLAVISGVDQAATIWAGGSATVYGSATGDQISGGVSVSGGGAAVTSETVDGGGTLAIGSGATGSATIVLAGGTETVSAGSATGDKISGALSTVSGAAGTLTSETVHDGGTLDLYADSNATGTIVQSGGTLVVSGAGTATNTVLSGNATLDLVTSDATLAGSLSFANGGNKLVVGAVASSGAGDQAVISGFTSTDEIDATTISAIGATLTFTSSGGNEIATISGTSGGAPVTESFVFSGTTTYNNFTLSLTPDGSGGVDLAYNPAATSLTVSNGQTSTGIVVGTSETLTVQSGGTVSNTVVESGGTLVVSGVDVAAVVSSGGTEIVYGSATGDQIFGSVTVSDGSPAVTSETVESGGSLTISGGSDSASNILFGGTEIIAGGSVSGDQVYGTQETVGGSATLTNETVYGGATIDLDDASTATGTTVLDGGMLVVSGSAIATNTMLNGGAALDLATSNATLSGSLTFVNDDTLILGAIAGPGAGDEAVISGFYLGDEINVTALGSGTTLSFNSSSANETVTISGANGSESLTFAGDQFSSSNMYLVTSGGQTDLETSAAAGFTVYNSADASSIIAGPLALYSVPVDEIAPTQMNEGFTEIDKKASGFDLISTEAALKEDLIDEVEPVVIGPDGQLYLLDGHHTFTALLDSSWGASNPTVYVNVVANYSGDTEEQFVAQMEANNWWLPLNNGVPQTVNPETGAPIPTSLTALTNDPYRALEYSILKQKDSKLFKNTDNISGATGASTPGLDKMTGAYSDFLEAAAYQGADGGLGLPYLSPGDIAFATQWNLNPDSTTALPNVPGTVYAYQLPGFILSQNIAVSGVVSNATLGETVVNGQAVANPLNEGAIDGNGTFTAITEINAGTAANPIHIGTPEVGFIMQLGNDRGYTVTLSNAANTYIGGTTITAGTLVIAADGSLGTAPAETNAQFLASLTLDSAGVPDNVDAAVQADNGIIFNSLTEGNGTLIIGTTSGEYTASNPFVTDRPIAVGSEAATIDANGSVVYLDGSLVTYGGYGVGLGTTEGFSPFTIDSFSGSSGGSSVGSSGTLYLTVASPYMYGDIIVGDIGSPIVNVTADDELGNTTGPAASIGEVELNGGTLQTGASFTATERNLFLGNNSSFDVDGNTTSWGTLTDDGEKLDVKNSSTTSAGAVTFAALDIGDTAVLQLAGGTEGETVTFADGIVRTNNDTLIIEPSTSSSLGASEQVFSGVGPASLVDNVAPVWIVDNNDSANGAGPYNFVTYGADGYVTATYNSTVLTASTGSDVVALGADAAANANVAAYALNTEGNTIALGGNTLTIGDGTDAAGLILASGSAISNGTLAFGDSEGVIWTSGSNAAISAEITGTNGLTFSGSGTVAISHAANVSGLVTINSGTVSLTAANVFAGDVDGVTLANSADPAEATLNFTQNQSFSTLNSAGTDSAITFSNGASLTIGDSNDESSTYSGTITETGAAANGALTIGGTGLVDLSGMSSKDLTLVAGSTINVESDATFRIVAKAITNSNTINVASGGVVQFAENGGDVLAGNMTGQGEVMLLGGILQLTGTGNTYSGGTYVDLGSTLELTTNNVSTGNANIADAGGLIDFDQDFSGIYSGVISDAEQIGGDGGTTPEQGTLIKDDSANSNASNSNVTLTAVQAYSGATYIEAGTLTLGVADAIADSSGVTLGRVGGAIDGQTATLALEADNTLASLTNNASNTTSVVLNGHTLTLTPASGTDSNFGGTIVDGSAAGGSVVVDGAGTVTLGGANTFTGGTTLDAGILELEANNSAGSGAITFGSASAMLRLDATLSGGTTTFANALTNLVVGDRIDLEGLQFESGTTTTTFSGSTLTVTNGTATESFTLSNPATANFLVTADNTGGVLLTAETAVAPTITGTNATDTTSETSVEPFSGVTIGDSNNNGTDTDTLTIALSNSGATGTLSGTGLSGGTGGVYTLSGTAATITSELDALTFTPTAGAPNTTTTTTFTLSDLSSAYSTPTVNGTTSVTDADPAVAPTITGAKAGQTTTSEAPVTPFSGVTIGDSNSGATDTLTITSSGGGGTLFGTGLSHTGAGVYELSGSAATITGELDALTFTPAAGAPNTRTTTTFTLSDLSSAYSTPTVNSTTSVTDADPAVAPTITGTLEAQTITPVSPFSGLTVADANSGTTDTLTIASSGGGGTLSGTGLSRAGAGVYELSGSAATITSELDALTFTPTAGPLNTVTKTVFTLRDATSANTNASLTLSVYDFGNSGASLNLTGSYNEVIGGSGNDIVTIAGADNSVTLGNGSDIVVASGSDNVITVGSGNDAIVVGNEDTVKAGNGNDIVSAGMDSTVTLGTGNDTVSIGADSVISVGNGRDTVNAGAGDTITLGGGNDTVAFGGMSRIPSAIASETIVGFASNDVINFNAALFTNYGAGATFATVMADTTQTAAGAKITLPDGEGTVLLAGVKMSSLTAHNFTFS